MIEIMKWIKKMFKKSESNLPISNIRGIYSCEKNWAIDTNKHIKEHDPFVCCKCGGLVTIDQMPNGMKFKERIGTLQTIWL